MATGKGKAGRKTKRTDELTQEIEKLFRVGLSQRAVCHAISVNETTFIRWKKNKKFNARVQKAISEKKAALLAKIFKAGDKNWQAHAWLLERCYPDEFACRTKLLGGGEKGEHEFVDKTRHISDEELDARILALKDRILEPGVS